jgi:hypothetical protein
MRENIPKVREEGGPFVNSWREERSITHVTNRNHNTLRPIKKQDGTAGIMEFYHLAMACDAFHKYCRSYTTDNAILQFWSVPQKL